MEDSKKPNKITEIVKLHQILKKWRRLANNSSETKNNKSIKFLKRTLSLSKQTTAASGDNVPKGFLAVCVGEELKKFVIPTEYLSHQAFGILLREAEEEFGFQHEGVLRIPCEVQVFMSILKVIEKKKNVMLFTNEFGYSGDDSIATCCSSETLLNQPCQPHSPMCR